MHTRKLAASLALFSVLALTGCSAGQPETAAAPPADQAVRTLPATVDPPAQTTPAPATSTPASPVPQGPPGSPDPTSPVTHGSGNQGIAYTTIPFEPVKDEAAPPEVQRLIQELKDHAAEKTVVVDGTTYAVITAGERNSGGYSVEVQAVGDSEGKLEVVYAIKQPAPGQMTTQQITYPYAVIKFKDGANLPVIFRSVK